jgi:hypothetical protein
LDRTISHIGFILLAENTTVVKKLDLELEVTMGILEALSAPICPCIHVCTTNIHCCISSSARTFTVVLNISSSARTFILLPQTFILLPQTFILLPQTSITARKSTLLPRTFFQFPEIIQPCPRKNSCCMREFVATFYFGNAGVPCLGN